MKVEKAMIVDAGNAHDGGQQNLVSDCKLLTDNKSSGWKKIAKIIDRICSSEDSKILGMGISSINWSQVANLKESILRLCETLSKSTYESVFEDQIRRQFQKYDITIKDQDLKCICKEIISYMDEINPSLNSKGDNNATGSSTGHSLNVLSYDIVYLASQLYGMTGEQQKVLKACVEICVKNRLLKTNLALKYEINVQQEENTCSIKIFEEGKERLILDDVFTSLISNILFAQHGFKNGYIKQDNTQYSQEFALLFCLLYIKKSCEGKLKFLEEIKRKFDEKVWTDTTYIFCYQIFSALEVINDDLSLGEKIQLGLIIKTIKLKMVFMAALSCSYKEPTIKCVKNVILGQEKNDYCVTFKYKIKGADQDFFNRIANKLNFTEEEKGKCKIYKVGNEVGCELGLQGDYVIELNKDVIEQYLEAVESSQSADLGGAGQTSGANNKRGQTPQGVGDKMPKKDDSSDEDEIPTTPKNSWSCTQIICVSLGLLCAALGAVYYALVAYPQTKQEVPPVDDMPPEGEIMRPYSVEPFPDAVRDELRPKLESQIFQTMLEKSMRFYSYLCNLPYGQHFSGSFRRNVSRMVCSFFRS